MKTPWDGAVESHVSQRTRNMGHPFSWSGTEKAARSRAFLGQATRAGNGECHVSQKRRGVGRTGLEQAESGCLHFFNL
jgi:hypothetical protein